MAETTTKADRARLSKSGPIGVLTRISTPRTSTESREFAMALAAAQASGQVSAQVAGRATSALSAGMRAEADRTKYEIARFGKPKPNPFYR